MVFIRNFILSLSLLAGTFPAFGQDEFCNGLTTIARDAPNKFRNVRGNLKDESYVSTTWDCQIKLPGVIESRFVASMGLFYEGALYQSKMKEGLMFVYDRYKVQLANCLEPLGYKMALYPNFAQGLDEYKKVVFMLDPNGDKPENAPAHITLEVLYSKPMDSYSVVVYVFEH